MGSSIEYSTHYSMSNYLSYGWLNSIEKKGHYLVGVAASVTTAVLMVTVATAVFKIVVGAVVAVAG